MTYQCVSIFIPTSSCFGFKEPIFTHTALKKCNGRLNFVDKIQIGEINVLESSLKLRWRRKNCEWMKLLHRNAIIYICRDKHLHKFPFLPFRVSLFEKNGEKRKKSEKRRKKKRKACKFFSFPSQWKWLSVIAFHTNGGKEKILHFYEQLNVLLRSECESGESSCLVDSE